MCPIFYSYVKLLIWQYETCEIKVHPILQPHTAVTWQVLQLFLR